MYVPGHILQVGCGSVGLIFSCAKRTAMTPVATTSPNIKFFISPPTLQGRSKDLRYSHSRKTCATSIRIRRFGPRHALDDLRHRPHPFIKEALNARAGVRLRRVEVALRVGIQVMDAEELAG